MDIDELEKIVLLGLYDFRIEGGFKSLNYFFNDQNMITRHQSKLIFNHLDEKGFVKGRVNSSGYIAEITFKGIKYVEEYLLRYRTYNTIDKFSESEKSDVLLKLDDLLVRIKKIELGQQIIHDSFEDEINELKVLINILGKKNWKQLLLGKLVDTGLGSVTAPISEILIDLYKDNKLIS